MKLRSYAIRRLAAVAALAAAAGCSSTTGTGGLAIPQAPGYNQPAGPATVPQAASRQQVQSTDLALAGDAPALALPATGGFGISIALGATPAASMSPAASPAASGPPRVANSPSASPSATGAASAVPSAVVSASPQAVGSPAASPTAKPSARPAVKIAASTVAYPETAPAAPTATPAPGSSASPAPALAPRTVLVRGSFRSPVKLAVSGLDAISVTLPSAESTTGRGFTLALYRKERKKHEALVASDPALAATGSVVKGVSTTPLALAAGETYEIYLYGDPISTPQPVASSYPTPGTNPFYPTASGAPAYPGASGLPAYGAPGATPLPGAPTITPLNAPGAGGLPAPH